METYVIKIIVASGLFLGVYFLLLQKERMLQVRRFYLLATLILAYIMPFITIPQLKAEAGTGLFVGAPVLLQAAGANQSIFMFDIKEALLAVWGVVTFSLLVRFVVNLSRIVRLRGKISHFRKTRVMIGNFPHAPFSFLNTIYLSKEQLKNGQPEEQILLHENCHVQQRHSVDVLLLESLLIVSWWNPFLYFYRKAVFLNHEYLADDAVLTETQNASAYADLILQNIAGSHVHTLTHHFNFIHIKKRFTMMNTSNSRFAGLKKWVLLPAVIVTGFLFANKKVPHTAPPKAPAPAYTDNIEKLTVVAEMPLITQEQRASVLKETQSVITAQDTIRPGQREEVAAPPIPPPPPSEGFLPQFPDGINAFRTLLQRNFDISALKTTKGIVSTKIYFTIDENGKMSDFEADGTDEAFNKEAVRAVTAIAKDITWTPATEKGKAVKYRFYLPMTMSFE